MKYLKNQNNLHNYIFNLVLVSPILQIDVQKEYLLLFYKDNK